MDGIAHFLEGVQANGQGGSHTDRIGGMTQRWALGSILLAVGTFCSLAQTTDNPFPTPIAAEEDVIRVDFVEFVSIPDMEGEAARVMILVDEPGTGRLFVNDMRGPVYTVSYNGRPVVPYLDVDDPKWGVPVQSSGRERGMQSFAVHPQFAQNGTPGFGKLYVWDRHQQDRPASRLRPRRRRQYPRYRFVGVDRQHARCRALRWRSAPGGASFRAAFSQS